MLRQKLFAAKIRIWCEWTLFGILIVLTVTGGFWKWMFFFFLVHHTDDYQANALKEDLPPFQEKKAKWQDNVPSKWLIIFTVELKCAKSWPF